MVSASAVGRQVRKLGDPRNRVAVRRIRPRRRRTLRARALSGLPLAASAGAGAAGGAVAIYFLDPSSGRRRRVMLRDRTVGLIRHGYRRVTGRAEVAARVAHDHAIGAAHEARRSVEPERPAANDQELADRVRTELFRPAEVPKGAISINAEMGVIYLRGEVERPEQIDDLVSRAEQVEGVRAVQNLLHVPGQPAPMKQETERETRRRVFASRPG